MDKKPTKGKYLEVLLRSSQTIFSIKDASLLWGESVASTISNRFKNYVRDKKIKNILNDRVK